MTNRSGLPSLSKSPATAPIGAIVGFHGQGAGLTGDIDEFATVIAIEMLFSRVGPKQIQIAITIKVKQRRTAAQRSGNLASLDLIQLAAVERPAKDRYRGKTPGAKARRGAMRRIWRPGQHGGGGIRKSHCRNGAINQFSLGACGSNSFCVAALLEIIVADGCGAAAFAQFLKALRDSLSLIPLVGRASAPGPGYKAPCHCKVRRRSLCEKPRWPPDTCAAEHRSDRD